MEGNKWNSEIIQNHLKSLNWHLTAKYNYNCFFCFGQFKGIKGCLAKSEALRILAVISKIGIDKIILTGGEPLLYPHLEDILVKAKQLNFTTMIVSNGSLINKEFLQMYHKHIDWIGLSLDSANENTELKLGRGFGSHVQTVREISTFIKEFGVKLKINTVITSLNYQEDMIGIIEELNPNRWKVFQVLKVDGENDGIVEPLLVSEEQFMSFVERHKHLNPIYETNDIFRGSYVMLDPLGRFFQNSKGYIEYSRSILKVVPLEALEEVGWNREKFLRRGGIYEWD